MPKYKYQRELPLDEKFQLAKEEVDRLRSQHYGEMYGCMNCYGGYKCTTRALIQMWDYITQEMDLA